MALLTGLLALLFGNAAVWFLTCRKNHSSVRPLLIASGAELVLLSGIYYIVSRFTLCENLLVPMLMGGLACGAVSLCVQLREKTEASGRRFLRSAAALFALVTMLELTVFQLRSFSAKPQVTSVPLTEAELQLEKRAASLDGETLVITDNTTVKLPFSAQNTAWLALELEAEAGFYEIASAMQDDNFSEAYIRTARARLNSSQDTVLLAMRPHGSLHAMSLHFTSLGDGETIRISGIRLLSARPYGFSWLRILLLAGVLLLCAAVRCFGWHRIEYDRTNLIHREAVAILMMLCIFAAAAFCGGGMLREYDPDGDMTVQDPYYQTFDAWQKGQLHLDLPVDDALLALENPYDHSARTEAGAESAWDRAFYDGKYYSYFGISPVLFVYYPVYVLTGQLPTVPATVLLFTVLAIAALFALILTLVKCYCPHVKLLQLLLGLAAAASASGLYLCMNYADFYYTALVAGMAFLYLFLWMGFSAVLAETRISRLLRLAVCGLAVTGTVLSRPNMAVYALLLVPPFLSMIRRKTLSGKDRLAMISAFFVPVLLGAAGVMAYNAARFGSPIDFGTAYQLTVSDTSANTLRLSALPEMLGSYFFHPLRTDTEFPFLAMDTPPLGDTGQYVYAAPGFGLLLYPCIAAGMVLAVLLLRKKRMGTEQLAVYAGGFLLAVLLAFLDYCMGGYNLRYQCDVLPVLGLFSVMLLLEAGTLADALPQIGRTANRCVSLTLAATPAFVCVMLPAMGTDWAFWYLSPSLYFDLQELLVFW